MKIKLLEDNVAVKISEIKNKTESGLYISAGINPRQSQGIVVSIGEGKTLSDGSIKSPVVKVGDKVVISSFAGTNVQIGKDEITILKESEILAIVE